MENILILGAKGMLGGELRKVFPGAVAWDREDVDATNFEDLRVKTLSLNLRPEAIINCVAFNDVDGAEEKQGIAEKLNVEVPGALAVICKELGIPLVHFSTNYVFDDEKGEHKESDQPSPSSVYARTKYGGELEIQKNTDKYYILRTAVLFGPKGLSELSKKSFIDIMLDLSAKSATIKAVEDEVNSVTYVKDLAGIVKDVLTGGLPYGLYHTTNSGQASWYDLAKEIFRITGKNVELVPVPSTEFPRKAKRPKKSVLLNTKLPRVRPWQEALAEFLATQNL